MPPRDLTTGQALLLAELKTYFAAHGHAPSLRELSTATGKSVSAVIYQINKLAEKGYLTRTPNVHRSLAVVEGAA